MSDDTSSFDLVRFDPITQMLQYAHGNMWSNVPADAITTPAAGANTQVQFNNMGAFGASSAFTYNGTTLTVGSVALNGSTGVGTFSSVHTPSIIGAPSLVIQPASDTDTAIQFKNAAGSGQPMLNIDTLLNRVGIGTSSPSQELSVSGNVSMAGQCIVGGATPSTACALEIDNFVIGLGLPRVTTAQMNAISPARAGNTVYVTDVTPGIYTNDGTSWNIVGTVSNPFVVSASGPSKIDIESTTAGQTQTLSLSNTANSDYAVIQLDDSVPALFIQTNGSPATIPIQFFTNNGNGMSITDNGTDSEIILNNTTGAYILASSVFGPGVQLASAAGGACFLGASAGLEITANQGASGAGAFFPAIGLDDSTPGIQFSLTASGSNDIVMGGTGVPSALMAMTSTTKGFLPPVMTTTQKNAISSPATGLVVFDSTLGKLCVFSTTWQTITSA